MLGLTPRNKLMAINMQSYLPALLLILLLLVDNSLSSGITPPTITRTVEAINEFLQKPATEYLWGKVLESIKNRNSNPQLPNALPRVNQNIPGLSGIKDYLSQFGYLQDTGPYNDVLDMHTISAISAYQKFFKLQVTGDINKETIQQMSLPRCGVPDLNFEYNLTTSKVSWPKGKPQWFGTKNLTYGFHPASKVPLNMTNVFRDAFTRWSQTTRLVNFTESLTYVDADIKIGFYNFREGADDAVIGESVIIRLRSGVKTGVIRLDSSKKLWMVEEGKWSYTEGKFDLETTAMHQIGHLLGLEHSSNNESVMYPSILPTQQRKVLITDSDNETIHQLYTITNSRSRSATSGSFALFGSSSVLITTFSLGFLCMALSL